MSDINKMSLKDFNGVMSFADRKNRMMSNKPVELKSEQIDMIKRAKEKIKT